MAEKATTIYFVEVKYRQTNEYGGGLEYITPRKLRQMSFAADFWLQDHHSDQEFALAGLEVGGENFVVTSFIESLT